MKIAVTGTRGFPGIQGGVENHCEKLYPYLAKKGCDITVYTRKPYVIYDFNSFENISLIQVACPKNRFLEAIVHTFRSIIKARAIKPDILHIHAIGPSVFAPFARVIGMKVVVTHHGPDYKRKKWNFGAKLFLKFCEWMGMKFANEVIAISNNIADDIKQKFRRSAVVIPNGVDIPQITETDDILEKLDIQKKRYIFAVGRFVPEKGFDDLIEAFNNGDFKNWKLVIAGDADHEDNYSSELKIKASKNSKIVLTGFLTGRPLNELYAHAGLFVLPSYYEGLPIVLLEAMSYGLSCIASDIPANKSLGLLSDDRLFNLGDVNALAAKIREFIDKSLTKEEKGETIEIIAEKYNWTKIADETLKVYKQVAN